MGCVREKWRSSLCRTNRRTTHARSHRDRKYRMGWVVLPLPAAVRSLPRPSGEGTPAASVEGRRPTYITRLLDLLARRAPIPLRLAGDNGGQRIVANNRSIARGRTDLTRL